VALSYGDCTANPLALTEVVSGPFSAAAYLKASAIRLIISALPRRSPQCALYWPGIPAPPMPSVPGLDIATSIPFGVVMRSQITSTRSPIGPPP